MHADAHRQLQFPITAQHQHITQPLNSMPLSPPTLDIANIELYQSFAPKLCTELYQKLQLIIKSYHQSSKLPASCSLTAKLADCLYYQPLGSETDSDTDS